MCFIASIIAMAIIEAMWWWWCFLFGLVKLSKLYGGPLSVYHTNSALLDNVPSHFRSTLLSAIIIMRLIHSCCFSRVHVIYLFVQWKISQNISTRNLPPPLSAVAQFYGSFTVDCEQNVLKDLSRCQIGKGADFATSCVGFHGFETLLSETRYIYIYI